VTAAAVVVGLAGWLLAGVLGGALRARACAAARAAHELRGPLCAARLALHGLGAGPHAARVAAADLELRRAALALEELGGRRPAPRVGSVDVCGLLRECAPAWRALAARHGARLVVEARGGPVRVVGDRLRLAQACANLVANAAEHGGGSVRVVLRAERGAVQVEVRDDGPGLPAPVAELVARARGRCGRRGHGLAVAAAVAEAHGGRLAAAPARAGARVVLELPAAAGGAPQPLRARRRRRTPATASGLA
jgi:signal transduction histidine kinase